MTYEQAHAAAGYDFAISSNVSRAGSVLGRLMGAFPEPSVTSPGMPVYSLWEPEDRDRSRTERFTLSLDDNPIQHVDNAGSMVDWLLMDVTRKAVERTDGYVSIHAGVVSIGSRAVILPAAPSSGKTTTTAGLVRAGASYLSDEVALLALDRDEVHPFPRPLVMDASSVDAVTGLRGSLPADYEGFRGRWFHVAPDDLRPTSTGGPSNPAFIVAPHYSAGSRTQIRPLTRGETLFVLAEHAFDLGKDGSKGLDRLRELTLEVPGYALQIGDLYDAVAVITDLATQG